MSTDFSEARMGRISIVRLSGVVAAAGVLGYPLIAAARQSDRLQDEAVIQRAVEQMTDSFNRHDAKAAAALYGSDADFVNAWGLRIKGQAEIEAGLARLFATRARNASLSTTSVTIRFIRRDVAIVHVQNEMRGLIDLNGSEMPPHEELSVRVFVKDRGSWGLTTFQNTLVARCRAEAWGLAFVPIVGGDHFVPGSPPASRTRA